MGGLTQQLMIHCTTEDTITEAVKVGAMPQSSWNTVSDIEQAPYQTKHTLSMKLYYTAQSEWDSSIPVLATV